MGFKGGLAMKVRLGLAWMLLTCASVANAQAINGAPYLAVQGQASQEVTPDIFPLELTLVDTSQDAAATQAKIEKLAKDVLAIADVMKIEEADLTISNLSISPEYKYDDDTDKQIFLGNTYEREIKIRFHSLDKMREFISALPLSKALRIDTGTFGTSKSEVLKQGLLEKAIKNARATAEALASGVGRRLGSVHTISNQGFNIRYAQNATSLDTVTVVGNGALATPGLVSLREGRITLDQSVYIVYTLID